MEDVLIQTSNMDQLGKLSESGVDGAGSSAGLLISDQTVSMPCNVVLLGESVKRSKKQFSCNLWVRECLVLIGSTMGSGLKEGTV